MFTALVVLTMPLVAGQIAPGEPIESLGVQGRHVTINGQPTFLVGQMGHEFARGRAVEDVRKIFECMMVPYGMNLVIGDSGVIFWGGWNNLVNVRRGLEESVRPYDYPWKRTGAGKTTFGGPRFDLDQLAPAYFDSLAVRLKVANECGIVPVVGVFSEHAIDHPLHWRGHPFHPENNINHLGLPSREAIPEYFENARALEYQEAYVLALLEAIEDTHYILSPFGEVKVGSKPYFDRWLGLFAEYERERERELLVCVSGRSEVLDMLAPHPAVDLLDVYCYHGGRYDDPEFNVTDGPRGIRKTITEAWEKYRKPVGKLYFTYGYPYANPESPWADAATGTRHGGSKTAAREALRAVHESGGFGIYFKMAWARDRGEYMKPDLWSEYVREFRQETESKRARPLE